MSGYMKPNSKTRFTTKFYDHYKALETKLVNPRGKKGGIFSLKELTDNKELVDARKVWLIRRLAEEHAPELLRGAEAVTAQPGRTKDALRQQALHEAYVKGAKKTIEMLAPRGGGRLTNARSTLRRCVLFYFILFLLHGHTECDATLLAHSDRAVLAALCCVLEKGQYRSAARDLHINNHDVTRHKDLLVDLIQSNDMREVRYIHN